MNIRNIMLFAVCVLIGVQTLSGKEPEVQSLINDCEAKGMEKQKAEALINAILLERQIPITIAPTLSNRQERVKIRLEALKAIDTLSSNKLARPIALGLWNNSSRIKKAAIDRLFELKDPTVTDIVIQALEDNIPVKDGSETTPHSAFVYELVKLLNALTGSNYQLNIYFSDESQRAAIVKAAKDKLAKQKEMEIKGMTSDNPTNILLEKEGHLSGTNF